MLRHLMMNHLCFARIPRWSRLTQCLQSLGGRSWPVSPASSTYSDDKEFGGRWADSFSWEAFVLLQTEPLTPKQETKEEWFTIKPMQKHSSLYKRITLNLFKEFIAFLACCQNFTSNCKLYCICFRPTITLNKQENLEFKLFVPSCSSKKGLCQNGINCGVSSQRKLPIFFGS